jgi:thymidylate kinase
LVFYIDADASVLAKRAGFGEERFEKVEFQTKVEQAYKEFKLGEHAASELPKDGSRHWINIAAKEKSIEELHAEIVAVVEQYKEYVLDKVPLSALEGSLFK